MELIQRIDTVLQDIGQELALIIALLAVTGSLALSNIFGWSPCELCLYQRAFMYPLVLVIGASIMLGIDRLRQAGMALAVLGAPVSLYHHLLVRFDPTQGCGLALPCSIEYQLDFGIIAIRPMHIPLLSAMAFIVIAVLLWRDGGEG